MNYWFCCTFTISWTRRVKSFRGGALIKLSKCDHEYPSVTFTSSVAAAHANANTLSVSITN